MVFREKLEWEGNDAEVAEYFKGSREFVEYTGKKCFSKKGMYLAFGELIFPRTFQRNDTYGAFYPLVPLNNRY